VRLNPETVETDVDTFELRVQKSGQAGLSADERIALLIEAGDSYGGPLLPGFEDDWIEPVAHRLENLFSQAMVQLSKLLIQNGNSELAVKYAQQAVRTDPICEEAVKSLMSALLATGEHAPALLAFRTFESRLRQELDAEPSAAIMSLVSQLEQSSLPFDGITKSGVPRCSDNVSNVLPQGRSAEGSRGVAGQTPKREELPSRLRGGEFLLRTASRFFGREEETERLKKMLTSPRTRLVTLTGPGGTGKTRLATEAAAHLMTDSAAQDGTAVFVPLADITDASRLFDMILKALGGLQGHGLSMLEQLAQALDAQPNPVLILDNFEQLVEEGAMRVQEILSRVSGVKILVTSRIKLGIAAEQEFHLSSLPTSAGETTLEALLEVPSIAMFVDRAQCVRPDFQLTSGNLDAVCQLCDYLEGLPLALELAAARITVLSPSQILAQVQAGRLDFLASRRRDGASRQRTLRATLDWSYHLLSEAGQEFLRNVSVFRGGWTMEACREVCPLSEPDALSLVALLRDSSLIDVVDGEEGLRFTLLETVREYAQEQLELLGEEAAVSRRHRDYFQGFAELAEANLYGADQVFWLDRLEVEHENLLAALAWSASDPEGKEAGLLLASSLGRFWQVHSHLAEGRGRLKEVLGRTAGMPPSPLRARALTIAGVLALDQADHREARLVLDESLAIYQKLHDDRGVAGDLLIVGHLARDQGLDAVAKELYEKALGIYRTLDDKRGVGQALHGLGIVALRHNEYNQAQLLCTESLATFRELDDKQEIAWLLFQLGNVAREQSNFEAARTLQEECLSAFRELKDIHGMSKTLYSLGFVAGEQGDFGASREFLESGIRLCQKLGDKRGIAVSRHYLAVLCGREGDPATALRLFEENVPVLRAAGDLVGLGWSLLEQARMSAVLGEFETAQALYEQSLDVCEGLGNDVGCADTWNRVGWTSHALWKEHGLKLGKGLTFHDLGNIATEQEDFSTARTFFESGLDLFVELDKKDCIARSLLSLRRVRRNDALSLASSSLFHAV
jgi:predicted ATPase